MVLCRTTLLIYFLTKRVVHKDVNTVYDLRNVARYGSTICFTVRSMSHDVVGNHIIYFKQSGSKSDTRYANHRVNAINMEEMNIIHSFDFSDRARRRAAMAGREY